MKRIVLLLCAGRGRRFFRGREPKHLAILMDGETILSRLVRQLKENGLEDGEIKVVVGYKKELFFKKYPNLNYIEPRNWARYNNAVTLRSLSEYWLDDGSDEKLVIMGDVVMADETLKELLTKKADLIILNGRGQHRWDAFLWKFNDVGARILMRELRRIKDDKRDDMWTIMTRLGESFVYHTDYFIRDADTREWLEEIIEILKAKSLNNPTENRE